MNQRRGPSQSNAQFRQRHHNNEHNQFESQSQSESNRFLSQSSRSQRSESSSFKGLSEGYQNWQRSHISPNPNRRYPTQSKRLNFFLVFIFTIIVSLQLYYILKSLSILHYFQFTLRILLLVCFVLIFISAFKWVIASQDRSELRSIPLIDAEEFEKQKEWLTKAEISKLKHHPRYNKVIRLSKSRRSSLEFQTDENDPFQKDIDENEYEIFEGLKED